MRIFPEKTIKGVGFAILRIFIATYVLFGILLYLRQDAYLFFPPLTPMEDCAELPNATIVNMEDTRAYYQESGTSTKIAVAYHGNGERACDSAYLVQWLVEHKYNVLAVEYAGYAGDLRKPGVDLLLHDVEHVDSWLKAKDFSEVLIIGRSIGTGFASHHASLTHPDKLLLISPFDTLSHVAQGHYTVYPASLMLKTELDNVTKAAFAQKVFIIHGTEDVIIPFERGKALFEKLPQKQKTFVAIPGHAHNDVLDAPQSWNEIKSFLEE